uniref:Uncharacterized protein n=1 Tax=viral metagenome TaxID=1070528 RepID=A0A6M3LSS3_9ZZZZ
MSISCCPLASSGDCDEIAWSTERYCIARQEHICIECGKTIKVGETFHLIRQMMSAPKGKRWRIWKTCQTCAIMREQLSCEEGYYIGAMRDLLKEYYGIDYITGELVTTTAPYSTWYEEEVKRYKELGIEAI